MLGTFSTSFIANLFITNNKKKIIGTFLIREVVLIRKRKNFIIINRRVQHIIRLNTYCRL